MQVRVARDVVSRAIGRDVKDALSGLDELA